MVNLVGKNKKKIQEINGASFSGHVLNLKKKWPFPKERGGGGGSACLRENSLTFLKIINETFP